MNARSKYNDLVKGYIEPCLKEYGLIKDSPLYYIRNDLLLRFFTLEQDKFNYPGKYAFRIIIGIEGIIGSNKKPTPTNDSNESQNNIPILRISLSEIAGQKLVAYSIDEKTELISYASLIIEDIKKYALPVLINTNTIEDLEKLISKINEQTGLERYFFTMAIFCGAIGMLDKSKKYFMKTTGDRQVIVKTAATYGINLND